MNGEVRTIPYVRCAIHGGIEKNDNEVYDKRVIMFSVTMTSSFKPSNTDKLECHECARSEKGVPPLISVYCLFCTILHVQGRHRCHSSEILMFSPVAFTIH